MSPIESEAFESDRPTDGAPTIPAEVPSEPEMPFDIEAVKAAMEKLREASDECDHHEAEYIDAKELAASKKKTFEASSERVRVVSRNLTDMLNPPEPLPLFDKPKDPEPAEDTSWRDVSLADIGLSTAICEKLAAVVVGGVPMTTVGLLSDWQKASGPHGVSLTSIDGIGEAKARAIEEALADFWKTRNERKAAKPAQPDPADTDIAAIDADAA